MRIISYESQMLRVPCLPRRAEGRKPAKKDQSFNTYPTVSLVGTEHTYHLNNFQLHPSMLRSQNDSSDFLMRTRDIANHFHDLCLPLCWSWGTERRTSILSLRWVKCCPELTQELVRRCGACRDLLKDGRRYIVYAVLRAIPFEPRC